MSSPVFVAYAIDPKGNFTTVDEYAPDFVINQSMSYVKNGLPYLIEGWHSFYTTIPLRFQPLFSLDVLKYVRLTSEPLVVLTENGSWGLFMSDEDTLVPLMSNNPQGLQQSPILSYANLFLPHLSLPSFDEDLSLDITEEDLLQRMSFNYLLNPTPPVPMITIDPKDYVYNDL